MKKRKETLIILFYVFYFMWLFTVTFLTSDMVILNYFTLVVSIFYLIFLREADDFIWFILASLVPVAFAVVHFSDWKFTFNFRNLNLLPIWLPLAWGTTIVALRKLYLVLATR